MKPLNPIRRFDVFVEYQKVRYVKQGISITEAMSKALNTAYMLILVSKLLSPRKSLAIQLKTPEDYKKEIILHMGEPFYEQIFSIMIKTAFEKGIEYRSIKDSIRKPLNNWV